MSSAPFVATSAAGLAVQLNHVCARHPEMRGEGVCARCSNALCTACARSLPHRECPACRQSAAKPAHVVDVSWRIQLLIDALVSSFRAVSRRWPALIGILLVSLVAPLGLFLVLGGLQESDSTKFGVVGGLFALSAFALGLWLQPLMVLPTVARTSKGRLLVGALLGAFVSLGPLLTLCVAAVPLEIAHVNSELVGQFLGMAFMLVGSITFPVGLVLQGRALLGRGPSVRGTVGAVVAHFCLVGMWSTVLGLACVPLGVLVGVGVLVHPAVAGVFGVGGGVLVWLLVLLGMGSFAAASSRYSDDLERLS